MGALFTSLQSILNRKPEIKKHFVDFMQKVFSRAPAESAPPLREGENVWYLPCFSMYQHGKPDQIRVVYDSSAQYEGGSLNDIVLTGPSLNNKLLGVFLTSCSYGRHSVDVPLFHLSRRQQKLPQIPMVLQQ